MSACGEIVRPGGITGWFVAVKFPTWGILRENQAIPLGSLDEAGSQQQKCVDLNIFAQFCVRLVERHCCPCPCFAAQYTALPRSTQQRFTPQCTTALVIYKVNQRICKELLSTSRHPSKLPPPLRYSPIIFLSASRLAGTIRQ